MHLSRWLLLGDTRQSNLPLLFPFFCIFALNYIVGECTICPWLLRVSKAKTANVGSFMARCNADGSPPSHLQKDICTLLVCLTVFFSHNQLTLIYERQGDASIPLRKKEGLALFEAFLMLLGTGTSRLQSFSLCQ